MWESCHLLYFTRLYFYFLRKIRESVKNQKISNLCIYLKEDFGVVKVKKKKEFLLSII